MAKRINKRLLKFVREDGKHGKFIVKLLQMVRYRIIAIMLV